MTFDYLYTFALSLLPGKEVNVEGVPAVTLVHRLPVVRVVDPAQKK